MHHLRRTLAVSLFAALLVASCGGGSTPATTSGDEGATAAPAGATTAPGGETTAPAGGGTGSGEINLGSAAGALDNLDNYQFRIAMTTSGTAEFIGVGKDAGTVMEGGVVFKPEPQAAQVKISSTGGAAAGSAMEMRIIGDMSYINIGGDQWMASKDDNAQASIDAYKPESLLGSYASVSDLKKVGDEEKNGVQTTHYQSTNDMGMAGSFGLPDGKWVLDVWIAKDGGYVVATQATAEAKEGADTGSFTMSVDITGANDPSFKIEVPQNIMEIPS